MELLAVVIILGILSAIALPKLLDLTNETLDGAVQGVAGSLGSASAINYAAFVANSGKAGVQRLNDGNVCSDAILGPLLVGGGVAVNSNGNGNNGNGNGNGNNGNGNGNGNGNNGNNGNGNNGNGNGNNGNGNGIGSGNGNGNGNGNAGGNNAGGNGASVSQLMPNTNGVSYAVLTPPTGDCSGANAAGTMVSCVLTATKGTVTRSATATVICTG